MVGHQPAFFHPGILAKFIAASRLARQVDGVVVFLVVDHHIGDVGAIETCIQSGHLQIEMKQIWKVDSIIALKDQSRAEILDTFEPFSSALRNASGSNVAMQFGNALVALMKPYAQVDYVVPASALLESSFGQSMIDNMQQEPNRCIDAYNNAIAMFPHVGIALLEQGELPLWQGKTNEAYTDCSMDPRPRALLLTLLARLVASDLFVHGMGGFLYDECMENWCKTWLGLQPCTGVMATATLQLPMQFQSLTQARQAYFSPSFAQHTKDDFLEAISSAQYGSLQKQLHFQNMRRWLASLQEPLHVDAFTEDARIASKRDWAFALYPEGQLRQLVIEINEL